jgi:hypothetical protein
MLIEFSSNSEDVKWAISKNSNDESNSTSLNKVAEAYVDGKSKYLINITDIVDNNSIYLNVFYKSKNPDNNKINSKLAYYVFKYMRGNDARNLFDLKLKNRTVSHSKKEKTYTLQFEHALENKAEEEDVTYYVKGIYNETLVKGEKLDSIAISESPSINLKIHNVTTKSGKIELKLENVEKPLACIKVLAKATSRAINEYMLYEVINLNKIDNKTKPSDNKNKTDNKTNPSDNKNKTDNKTNPSDNKNKTENKTNPSDNKNKTENKTNPTDDKNKTGNKDKQKGNTNTNTDKTKNSEKKSDNDNTLLWIILGIGGGLALIIIILLITVLVFNSKNKNLMDKVTNISFAGDRNGNLLADDDKNILK